MELTYQYSNFGVPGLGFKRGLERERRHRALRDGARRHGRSRSGGGQLRRLAAIGGRGRYGFYEALDLHAVAPAGRAGPWRSCAPTWPTTRA